MNKIFKNIGLLALTGILFTACNEDDNTNESVVDYSTATVTLSTLSPTSIDESAIDTDVESTYQIEIVATLAETQPVNAVIDLVQTGGTADSADFEGHTITIPAGSLSGSATVDILQTGDIEGDETLVIGGSSRANFNIASFEHTVTITNDYINTFIDLDLDWDGQVTIEEEDVSSTTVELCAIDFDVVLFDAATFANLGYLMATASCPESDSYFFGDGEYLLIAELYDNPHAGFGDTTDVPLTLNFNHEYFDNSGSIEVAGAFNLSSTSGQYPIAYLTVSNGGQTYEVTAY
ncbi:hypothetical protein KO494_07420 [Lacinutrix sp. C3R15]|uniref:hypothetical protein n=1 Tax=Flavobacteriaceae TaxID=49546 RepID=UPI001C09232A|nr:MULTISPECIES: hypothetical protein [Flavobacteriaceae]MBU2939366.1 hypothetical protein [Lacinutrix sp. C3R15]MDO6622681.1 hypothetical protein [Oceanihabitans sp. 1_MG-2023]